MDKRTILAVGLIITVIGLYNLLIIPKFNPPPPPPAKQLEPTRTEPGAPAPLPVPASPATAPAGGPAAPAAVAATPAAATPVPAAAPERVAVDRPLWSATFSNVGGGLESWRLKSYTYAKGQKDAGGAPIGGAPLEIVRPGSAVLPLSFVFSDPATQAAFSQPQAVQQNADGFTLTAADAHGLRLTRTYRFPADSYRGEVLITLENAGESPRAVSWEMAFGPGVDRHLPEKDRSADEVVTFLAASGFDDVKV